MGPDKGIVLWQCYAIGQFVNVLQGVTSHSLPSPSPGAVAYLSLASTVNCLSSMTQELEARVLLHAHPGVPFAIVRSLQLHHKAEGDRDGKVNQRWPIKVNHVLSQQLTKQQTHTQSHQQSSLFNLILPTEGTRYTSISGTWAALSVRV
jgi:hypothetical protein